VEKNGKSVTLSWISAPVPLVYHKAGNTIALRVTAISKSIPFSSSIAYSSVCGWAAIVLSKK
jgi:hypothetical protein